MQLLMTCLVKASPPFGIDNPSSSVVVHDSTWLNRFLRHSLIYVLSAQANPLIGATKRRSASHRNVGDGNELPHPRQITRVSQPPSSANRGNLSDISELTRPRSSAPISQSEESTPSSPASPASSVSPLPYLRLLCEEEFKEFGEVIRHASTSH